MNKEEYKESEIEWIGKIPIDWKIKRFKRYFTSGMGETILKQDLDENGNIPVYSATEENLLFGYVKDSNINLKKGDLIIPARGNSIGSVKIINDSIATSTQTTIYSKKIRKINEFFVYYYLTVFRNILFYYDNTAIPQITVSYVSENPIIVPPLDEQTRIAKHLDEQLLKIDTLINNTQLQIEKLQEYEKSVINTAVTKGLNPEIEYKESEIEWIGKIPTHWKIKKLKQLGNTKNGINIGAEFFGEGYPFVSYGDVYKNRSLPSSVNGLVKSTEQDKKLYSVEEGDVFFTRTSETINEIGIASVCINSIENATFAGFLIRFRPKRAYVNKSYSKFYFTNYQLRSFFVKKMNLVTRASLSQELLKEVPVLLPPLEEQEQIAQFLDLKTQTIRKVIANKEKQIELYKEYKKSLINDLVTGKGRI